MASLFRKGGHFVFAPLHVRYSTSEKNDSLCQVAISVPKKRFKKAVDRILIKRRIREAHRLHKHRVINVLQQKNIELHLIYIYTASSILNYDQIEAGVLNFINHLVGTLED